MNKKSLTACAVICTLCVLSMICLGQIKKNHSISPLAAANVEALTDLERDLQDENCEYADKCNKCIVPYTIGGTEEPGCYIYDGMRIKL